MPTKMYGDAIAIRTKLFCVLTKALFIKQICIKICAMEMYNVESRDHLKNYDFRISALLSISTCNEACPIEASVMHN